MRNIFSALSSVVKSSFANVSSAGPITVGSPADFSKIPFGFFRVRAASGRLSLGYNAPPIRVRELDAQGNETTRECASPFGLRWDVRGDVVYEKDGRTIKLEVPRAALPLVQLNYATPQAGVIRVAGHICVDTEMASEGDLFGWDGEDSRHIISRV